MGKTDELGLVKERIKALKEVEKELVESCRKLKCGTYPDDMYTMEIGERTSRDIENKKAFKMLGEKHFLEVVTVNKSSVARYLSESDIDRVSSKEVKTVKTVSVKKNPLSGERA